ncbi:hypothetical protein VKT23_012048 [Stygiomarasmius scandens]|uniref:Thaumatin-like protein n=1 Tax=Marasmiellus scandens TaxID=2682957 RepID=A0ABR1J7I5_9AGAR
MKMLLSLTPLVLVCAWVGAHPILSNTNHNPRDASSVSPAADPAQASSSVPPSSTASAPAADPASSSASAPAADPASSSASADPAQATGSTGKMRTFTVKNNCDYKIWPGMYTDPNVGKNRPNHTTGWEAPPKSSVSFSVPDDWKAGRIWGRTKCDFSSNSGPDSCATGGCNGGLECALEAGTGVPPASLAEWTLQGDGNQDWFDVSVVDGANIPLEITNNAGCKAPSCKADLNADCPAELKGKKGDGCLTACAANLDGNAANSPNCCSGDYDTPDKCPSSGVQHYDYFKKGCPDAYAYAYDESSKSSLWTCDSSKHADYTLTFCP